MKRERATCPVCGRGTALYPDGRLYYHYVGSGEPGHRPVCSGSCRLPAPAPTTAAKAPA